MQTTIELKDFQAHGYTSLTLRGGFMCVVGPTDSGKSSIVRALRWALYDSLRGTRHIRNGQHTAKVVLGFPDVVVGRVKGKEGNRYRVNDSWLDSVGVGVPPEVSKASKISVLSADKDVELELNVSQQLHPAFMVMESDSVKAKFVNMLTGGHVFDAAVRETNRLLKDHESKRQQTVMLLESNQASLKRFDHLDDREQKLKTLKLWMERLTTVTNLMVMIQDSVSVLESTKKQMTSVASRLTNVSGVVDYVQSRIERMEHLTQVKVILDVFRDIGGQYAGVSYKSASISHEIEELGKSLAALPDPMCDRCGQVIGAIIRKRHLH